MTNTTITTCIIVILIASFSLSLSASNYKQVMLENTEKMYKAKTAQELSAISGTFYRLAEKETDQWLPLYYASYSLVRIAFFSNDRKEIDKNLDVAQLYIDKLLMTKPQDSEVHVLQALLYSMRISGMMSGMKYSVLSNDALNKAEDLNKDNPRIYYCRGNNTYHTPSMFGGGKSNAKPIFEKAVRLYEKENSTIDFWPIWDKKHTHQLLELCKNDK